MFSDRHAYLQTAQFSTNLADLDRVDWTILQAQDFKRDPDDPEKIERYQAEALVHRFMHVDSIEGIVCYNKDVEKELQQFLDMREMKLKIVVKPRWYFR